MKNNTRKEEIAKTAFDLFIKNGYSNTSVNEIIASAGISKGGFYHYFMAKDDIIDFIIIDYVKGSISLMEDIIRQKDLNAIEKYNQMLHALQYRREQNREKIFGLFKLMESEENLLFKHRYYKSINGMTKPIILSILNQGVSEGLFKISNTNETAELILEVGTMYRAKIARMLLELKENKGSIKNILIVVDFLQETVEKLLGANKGRLQIAAEYQNIFK